MFKSKLLVFSTLIFIIINTLYFWEGALGGFNMLLWLFLAVVLSVLFFGALRQLYFCFKERFKDKKRFYKAGFVLLLLVLICICPKGVINYAAFESKSLLVAGREGSANCTTTLMLKENGRFKMRSVCFGIDEKTGFYNIRKDTIKFDTSLKEGHSVEFDYAVLDTTKSNLYFKKGNDTVPPIVLHISVNETKLR